MTPPLFRRYEVYFRNHDAGVMPGEVFVVQAFTRGDAFKAVASRSNEWSSRTLTYGFEPLRLLSSKRTSARWRFAMMRRSTTTRWGDKVTVKSALLDRADRCTRTADRRWP